MIDDWSLKDKRYDCGCYNGDFKHFAYDSKGKYYRIGDIETLRQKLIDDIDDIQDEQSKQGISYHLDTDDFKYEIVKQINRRFGSE